MGYAFEASLLTPVEEAPSIAASSCMPDCRAVGFDLRLLESFVALASELHFGRAAQKLGFAQPALSQQIQRLEAQLGTALFIRDARKVALTAAGTAFLAPARASLAAAVDARAAVAAVGRAASGRLPLSMNGDGLDYVRELLQAFTAAQPDVDLDVALKFQGASLEALVRHTVDASILWSGYGPPRGFEDTSALITAPGAGIAVRATHPLAMQPEIRLDCLDGQRLIMFPREPAPDVYDLVLHGLGGDGHFSSVHHMPTIGQGVRVDVLGALDNESVAPCPRWSGLQQSPTGIVHIPVVPAMPASLWLAWTGTATGPTRALAAFVDQARARREPGLTLVE